MSLVSVIGTKVKPKTLHFKGFPTFTPNLTPNQMFELGSFGGTYWRPIYSKVTKKNYKNVHKKYPRSSFNAFHKLPDKYLINPFNKYDTNLNYYKIKVGTTLRFWEKKKWITKYHPYGWVQWYCDFYMGKRSPDDQRQIKRWERIAGPNGRFYLYLKTLIKRSKSFGKNSKSNKTNSKGIIINNKNNKQNNNKNVVSPKIRQTLLHWAKFVK